MKSHSYKKATYRCEDCTFVGENRATMEVHLGRAHSENLECGLCEFQVGNLEKLDLHLFTCEIYQCGNCDLKEKCTTELKKHSKIEHYYMNQAHIKHLKMDRNNFIEVSCKDYYSEGRLQKQKP